MPPGQQLPARLARLCTSGRRAATDAQIVIVDSYLRKVTDPEADLVDFALAWVTSMVDHAEHAALVRQIKAELGHIPAAAVDAWQRVGPLRVRRQLARHLARLAERGMLRLDDPDRAAAQFSRLVSVTDSPPFGPHAPSPEEITETVASGVRVFLYGVLIS